MARAHEDAPLHLHGQRALEALNLGQAPRRRRSPSSGIRAARALLSQVKRAALRERVGCLDGEWPHRHLAAGQASFTALLPPDRRRRWRRIPHRDPRRQRSAHTRRSRRRTTRHRTRASYAERAPVPAPACLRRTRRRPVVSTGGPRRPAARPEGARRSGRGRRRCGSMCRPLLRTS